VQNILDSSVFQLQFRRPCWIVLAVLLGFAVAAPGAGRAGEMSADDEALRRDAIAAITRGDHITALSLFQESLNAAASTRRWRTRLQLAQVLGALGHHSEALGEYKRVIKRVTREDVGAAQSRGTDNDAPGNRSPSTSDHEMTQLLAAIKVAAASEAREAGRGKEAERLMEDAAHLHPAWRHSRQEERDCSARGLLAQGSDLYWSHYLYAQCVGDSNIHAHIKALEEATRLKPDWAVAYNEMGLRFGYWQERGRLDASAALLSHAVQLDPTSGIFATNLAMAYHHLGHLRTAADVAQRAAQLLPANAAVQEQLGRALEDTEHLKGALFAYTAAAELEPSRHDALCAQVFLSHYLCAWKGLKDKLRRLEHILRGPVLQRNGWGGTCDQPFRLFSYSLPPDVGFLLTAHVTAKEAANIPGMVC
jgi:tetratricopeptide (TPR) repeat protein